LSLREQKSNAKLAALCCALLSLSVLVTGCGGRAAMGWSAPVVDNGTLYFGSKTGKLYALDVETRETLWSFPAEGVLAGIYSTPVIGDGALFFGSYEIATTSFLIFQNQDIQGRAYALDAAEGKEDWHFPRDSSRDPEPFLGSPALGDGLVYFTSSDGSVYALETETGNLKWSFEAGKEIWGGPSWADGTLYVGSADKSLYALDAATGDQRWQFTAGGAIYSTPYISADLVYFGALDNKVYAVDRESGAEVWTYQTGNWVWARPIEQGGLLYAASLDHSLYALRLRTCSLPRLR
jgi:outer membrane protein assembly factor BamB